MLRRPDLSDLFASQPRDLPTPRAGEPPPALPGFVAALPYERHDPKREESDAAEQQRIADSVEGVIP